MTFVVASLRVFSGVIIWTLHFTAIYGATALACARGWPHIVPWVIGFATSVALLACGTVVGMVFKARYDFISWLSITIAAISMLAIVWEAVPVLVVPICG